MKQEAFCFLFLALVLGRIEHCHAVVCPTACLPNGGTCSGNNANECSAYPEICCICPKGFAGESCEFTTTGSLTMSMTSTTTPYDTDLLTSTTTKYKDAAKNFNTAAIEAIKAAISPNTNLRLYSRVIEFTNVTTTTNGKLLIQGAWTTGGKLVFPPFADIKSKISDTTTCSAGIKPFCNGITPASIIHHTNCSTQCTAPVMCRDTDLTPFYECYCLPTGDACANGATCSETACLDSSAKCCICPKGNAGSLCQFSTNKTMIMNMASSNVYSENLANTSHADYISTALKFRRAAYGILKGAFKLNPTAALNAHVIKFGPGSTIGKMLLEVANTTVGGAISFPSIDDIRGALSNCTVPGFCDTLTPSNFVLSDSCTGKCLSSPSCTETFNSPYYVCSGAHLKQGLLIGIAGLIISLASNNF